MAVPERDPMSDGYWLDVQDKRVVELEAEVERLLEALVRMDEAVCHGQPETAKRIARQAYGDAG